ncbi:MAG: hypothetical protein K0R19_3376, partial [Bacillota bacterium]|nr:hypothetical protein [Bacillota bacterium]
MQKAKKIAAIVIAGILLCGAAAGGYFIY